MKRLFRSEDDQRGMTLVELMTVLMVVAILMAIAAPTIQNQIALQQIRGAGQEVVQVLRASRDEALNEGVPRYVLFTPPRTYQVFQYDGGWVADESPVSLPNSISFTNADNTFPSLPDAPEAGSGGVPAGAAYFDTRGRYPYVAGQPDSYSITLHGGLDRTVTVTVWRNTGQVTGP
jgi:prepilin-type N-terminal cleavage/methylation domain-containing protein